MKSFRDLKVGLDEDLEEKLAWLVPQYSQYRVTRKSVDARRSQDPHWVYSLDVYEKDEIPKTESFPVDPIQFTKVSGKPLIIGSGPAGLFAALRLVERGIPCTLLERGSRGEKRIQAINRFWRYGELDLNNNVCFGEGGAGLYSDGKLITRIKSPHIPYVMHRLVQFGAPEEIQYLSNPHVGSDRIRRVIPNLRAYLESHGCEIHFDTAMSELIIKNNQVVGVRSQCNQVFNSENVILATGHSAEDVLVHLDQQGIAMEGKSFALGLRIEHPQSTINKIQYRKHAERIELGAANYRLADHDESSGIGVYSFCMCPGGFVLSSGTDNNGVVCNGMSNYHRSSPFANSAIVVSIDHDARFSNQLFGGLEFRQNIERAALQAIQKNGGTKQLPVQNMIDFLSGKLGHALKASSPSGVLPVRLDQILPEEITNRIRHSLENFDFRMKGFITKEAQFYGVESRTSCPVRITRNPETFESTSHLGLYPCGEGAGYAGGITSAACDGIRVAEAIAMKLSNQAKASQKSIT